MDFNIWRKNMARKLIGFFACILLIVTTLPISALSPPLESSDSPHLDFIANPGNKGFNLIIWNYGDSPAYFVFWEIETKGINDTNVIGGNRRGVIVCLRSKDSQYMAPLTFPRSKKVQPYGFGEIEITIRITCRNAEVDTTYTTNWMLNGFVMTPLFHYR